jgi:hypothetical protein
MRAYGKRLQHFADDGPRRERGGLELQLPRFDLRKVEDVVQDREQAFRRCFHRRQAVALIGRQIGVEQQVGHAHDAVHRCADLMAHVGQELAFRPAGVHRLVASRDQLLVRRPQLRRPGVDGLFEVLLLQQELLIAPLNLAEHLVEVVDEVADLVVGGPVGADVVVLAVANLAGHGDEPLDRAAGDPRGCARQPERDPGGPEHHARHGTAEPGQARPDLTRVRFDGDAADDFLAVHDRTQHVQVHGGEGRGR